MIKKFVANCVSEKNLCENAKIKKNKKLTAKLN